jgi:hypothetical protein
MSGRCIVNQQMGKRLPVAADSVYKNKGWRGWADFLGKK